MRIDHKIAVVRMHTKGGTDDLTDGEKIWLGELLFWEEECKHVP
jgi:hypothetical protein